MQTFDSGTAATLCTAVDHGSVEMQVRVWVQTGAKEVANSCVCSVGKERTRRRGVLARHGHGHVEAVTGVARSGETRTNSRGEGRIFGAASHPEFSGARRSLGGDEDDRFLSRKVKKSSGRRRGCRACHGVSRFPASGSREEVPEGVEAKQVAR